MRGGGLEKIGNKGVARPNKKVLDERVLMPHEQWFISTIGAIRETEGDPILPNEFFETAPATKLALDQNTFLYKRQLHTALTANDFDRYFYSFFGSQTVPILERHPQLQRCPYHNFLLAGGH